MFTRGDLVRWTPAKGSPRIGMFWTSTPGGSMHVLRLGADGHTAIALASEIREATAEEIDAFLKDVGALEAEKAGINPSALDAIRAKLRGS